MLVDLPATREVPHFGPHFLYDAFGCSNESLTNVEKLQKFLQDLPEQIGMTRISDPNVFEYHGVVPEDWGLTGGVFLAESHCTLHTFPEQGFVTLDIYSCKTIDVDRVLPALNEFFGTTMESVRHTVILRGVGFSRAE